MSVRYYSMYVESIYSRQGDLSESVYDVLGLQLAGCIRVDSYVMTIAKDLAVRSVYVESKRWNKIWIFLVSNHLSVSFDILDATVPHSL